MITQFLSKINRPRVLAAVIGLSALLAGPGAAQVTPVGGIARNFTLTNRANGQPINLTDFAGKVLVLDFFAYWCGPCQTSSPDVETNIQKYYAARGGNAFGVPVQVLAVNIEPTNPALTDAFVASAGLELVGNDPNTTAGAWSQFNETNGIPLFAILNCVAGSPSHAQWKVLYKQAGYAGATTLRGYIDAVRPSVTNPEIAVEQPVGTNLSDDSASISFGSVGLGSKSSDFTFTIKNTGSGNLTGLAITKDGANAGDFAVLTNPVAPVSGPSGSTTFTVRFTPSAIGTRTAAIHIVSNDLDENPFDITLKGTGFAADTAQEIVVQQPAGTNISDAGSKDFGLAPLGSSINRLFTILNIGGANLTGLAVTRYGDHAADFTAGALSNTTLTPGASATFTVTFAPSAPGARIASIRIASNDADENPFDISLSGQGELINTNITTIPPLGNASPYPSTLRVSGIAGTVAALRVKLNGLAHTWPDDMDVFLVSPGGQVCALMSDAGGSNLANCNLVFDDAAAVAIPDDSSITSGNYRPADYEAGEALPPGGSGSIGTNLLAVAGGNVNGDWKLYVSDDTGGEGGSIASWSLLFTTIVPEIAVEQPAGTNIADTGSKDFGSVNVDSNTSLTFTIRNIGTADLTGLAVTKDGANPEDFTVTSSPVAPVAGPSGTTAFTVQFAPVAGGSRSAVIHIASNDSDESPFDITLTGTGLLTAIQSWRQTHFGTVSNTGNAADTADPYRTGIANLLVFAFAGPNQNPVSAKSSQLPQIQKSGGNLHYSFTQPAGVSGVTYGAEWSPTLQSGSWTAVSDTGTFPQHAFSVPIDTNANRFMRLKVTIP